MIAMASVQHQAASSAWSRHYDHYDPECFADWVIARFDELASRSASPPLVVPLTVTFAPTRVPANGVLREFERFYVRLCRLLVNNYERPNKRHLLPFAIAWRDDPRTRPDKYRSRPAWQASVFASPSVAPHVHGVMVIHPDLVEGFRSIAHRLEAVWDGIRSWRGSDPSGADRPPVYANRSLRIESDLADRLSHGLSATRESDDWRSARAELARWVGYSAKLTRRRDAGASDAFTVLPTMTGHVARGPACLDDEEPRSN